MLPTAEQTAAAPPRKFALDVARSGVARYSLGLVVFLAATVFWYWPIVSNPSGAVLGSPGYGR